MAAVKEYLSRDVFETSWGWVGVASTRRGVSRLVLPRAGRAAVAAELGLAPGAAPTPWEDLRQGLRSFLAGRGRCPDVPADLAGLSRFSLRVLAAARAVPPGTTITYGELARRAGCPHGCRAVGQVMARNPVPLLIPCHRVVAAAGPGGYAGGVAMKLRLLVLESGSGQGAAPP